MEQKQEWTPLFRRVYAFWISSRKKIAGGLLYQPQENRGTYSQVQEIWILKWSKDCRFDFWKRGDRYVVKDAFELEPVDFDLWEDHKDDPDFAELRALVESVDGKVSTGVFHERMPDMWIGPGTRIG